MNISRAACCRFTILAKTTGHVDIWVPAGTSGDIGWVVLGCCFSSGTYALSNTGGLWQRVFFTNPEGTSNEFGLEIFSAGGGYIFIANPAAAVPEASSLLLLVTGMAGVGLSIAFRRRR